MNLENLGVQEMNSKEMTSIEGGGWFTDAVGTAIGVVVGAVVATVVVAAHIAVDLVVDHN